MLAALVSRPIACSESVSFKFCILSSYILSTNQPSNLVFFKQFLDTNILKQVYQTTVSICQLILSAPLAIMFILALYSLCSLSSLVFIVLVVQFSVWLFVRSFCEFLLQCCFFWCLCFCSHAFLLWLSSSLLLYLGRFSLSLVLCNTLFDF